jgi:hypothetical protein
MEIPGVKTRITRKKVRDTAKFIYEGLKINGQMTAFEVVQSLPEKMDALLVQKTLETLHEIGRIDLDNTGAYSMKGHPKPYPQWWFKAVGKK